MRKVAGANFDSDSEEMLILITNAWQLGEMLSPGVCNRCFGRLKILTVIGYSLVW